MKRYARAGLVLGAVVMCGSVLSPPTSQARPGPASTEVAPVSSVQDRAWSGTAGRQKATSSPVRRAASAPRPQSVDRATLAWEKAAAARNTAASRGLVGVSAPGPQGAAAAPSTPTLFNGLDRQSAANNGLVFTPPDTIMGKSPNRALEGTNSALRLFTSGGSVLGTADLNTFFRAPVANGRLFDPKVYYDRNAVNPRFFVVALQQSGRDDTNTANDVSRIWVAVARSTDPGSLSAGWCRYNINGVRNGGTASASWADFPAIGAGRDSFSFTTNQFRFTTRAFTFAVVNVWNKAVAENNASACPSVPRSTFQPSATEGDFSRFTIQPAQHYTSPSSFAGTANPAYFLSTRRGSSNEYRVYRVRNVAGGAPTLAQTTLTGAGYSIPPSSPQPPSQPTSAALVDTGDNRVEQVAGLGNTLVGTFTTGCNFTAGTAAESCTLTPRVSVGQNAGGGLSALLAENTFTGFGDNLFVHHPSVAVNTSLQAGATWLFSGASRSLSSASMTKNVGAPWTSVLTYAPGSCAQPSPNPPDPARSGDYTGAQTDPSTLRSFWLAGEQSVLINGTCQWRTRIAHLVP